MTGESTTTGHPGHDLTSMGARKLVKLDPSMPQLLLLLFVTLPAFAQAPVTPAKIDIAGDWAVRVTEDLPFRSATFELGDYTGLPINAAARQKASTWSASILTLPEHMTRPFGPPIAMRSQAANLRVQKVSDPVTQTLIAYTIEGLYGRPDRVIWMDGRPHPSEYAEHTWDGFSTGEVKGNQLIVTTTHMKPDKLQRNGVPYSFEAKMTENFIRHGDFLTLVTTIDDPVYLEEPLIRTTQWARSSDITPEQRFILDASDEIANHPQGYVPSYPLGTRQDDFAIKHGLPFEATLGGRETVYPEYELELRKMLASPK